MAIDYVSLENRLYEILLIYLYKTKRVDLKDSSYAAQLDSSSVEVNYFSDESIWFFRIEKDNGLETNYYFGRENDIELILRFSRDRSKSVFEFFESGRIAIKTRFTKEGAGIFNSMKKMFTIKNPASKSIKHNYIMLVFQDETEIIPVITKLINIIDFDYADECLLIKGFKENVENDSSSNLARPIDLESNDVPELEGESKSNGEDINEYSEESISDDYIGHSDNGFLRELLDSEDYEFSVEKTISEIDCSLFEKNSENESLGDEFDAFVNNPIFNIVSSDLDDDECSKLVVRIKKDISDEKISGDVGDVQEFYFEQYNLIKKQYTLNGFLNEYLMSDDFNKLLAMYDAYSDEVVIGIINQVRNDISDDDSMDRDKVILKTEYYFKAETNKNDYFNQIDKIKEDSMYYCNRYNLISAEFDEILDYIQTKISEGYHIKNVHHCLITKIKERIDLNRDESRLKLKKLLNNPEFIEKNNITQEQSDQISEHVGDLIYKNKIRCDEIYEDTLLAIRGRYL